MAYKFAEIAFTPTVKSVQAAMGSRDAYAKREARPDSDPRDTLGENERAFIEARDSFYMATVSETGWPYVQHRGGPVGFLRMLDAKTIGFADYSGNRQYVSVGNLLKDDRVSLFLMDYANKARLKILGRVRLIDADDRETLDKLIAPGTKARIERGMMIAIEAFDWNCSQHIPDRYSEVDVRQVVSAMQDKIDALEDELKRLKAVE
jgi:predicted pyridoxine 5'-phosphate oxidase superfamily flavin-nucleotide-binding protein